ncbi:unnamed protein product [Rotaria magnacalcarata]
MNSNEKPLDVIGTKHIYLRIITIAMTRTSNTCSVCQKELGTSFCTGCGVYFCTKDFKNHRKTLFSEMDAVIEHRNELQEKIHKAVQHADPYNPLFEQIDQWQRTMIEKICRVSEHCREQVSQLLNSKRAKLTNDFKRFSQDLIHLKQTENYVEPDITRLKYLMHQFNHELKQLLKPVSIELHTEPSDRIIWSQLLYVEEKSTYAGINQRQQHERDDRAGAMSPRKQPSDCYSSPIRSLIYISTEDLAF